MKKIIFCDIDTALYSKVRNAKYNHNLPLEVKNGNVFDYRGLVVSASNPSFTMGAGLDALISQYFPKECRRIKKRLGNQRIGDVIFTITVDNNLESSPKLVKKALRFALSKQKRNETLLLTGLGTGIGGLTPKQFISCLVTVLKPQPKALPTKRSKAKETTSLRWKFLRNGLKSEHQNCTWHIGQWKTHQEALRLCEAGYHCSERLSDAFNYVQGEVLARVEVAGDHLDDDNKQVWEKMRLIKTYKWTKVDSVSLAIFAAEQVIDIFEKQYPKDDRPRRAIKAAKNWLKNSSAAAAHAADSAAAHAAYADATAAAHAAYADATAYAAYAAAAHAADATAYAAYAVYAAAADAAHAAVYAAAYVGHKELVDKIEKWMVDRVSKLEEIK